MSLSSPCFCSLPPNLISFYHCLMLPSPYPSHSVASYIPIRIVSTKETLIIMLPLGSTSISPDFFPQKSSIFHHFPPVPLEFFHQQTCPRLGFLQPAASRHFWPWPCRPCRGPGPLPWPRCGTSGPGPSLGQGWWRWNNVKDYPLVNIQKAIENGHRNSGFSHEKWRFSSSLC